MKQKSKMILGVVWLLLFAIYTYDKITNNTSMRISDWVGLTALLITSIIFLIEGSKSSSIK